MDSAAASRELPGIAYKVHSLTAYASRNRNRNRAEYDEYPYH